MGVDFTYTQQEVDVLCKAYFDKGRADAMKEAFDKTYTKAYDSGYQQGRADALSIDMGKPMHFTDEQKAWVKKYIIINAELQRERAIEETICFIKHEEAEGNIHSLDDYDRIAELVKEQKNE